jgi:F-type H+-transporting ATPase subunit alpha
VKLALAQFRELQAFSQFASDLDDATRRQLEHGRRVTELMKQKQYSPLTVAEMGASLFAANERALDDVPVNKVQDFEKAWHSYLHSAHGEFMKKLDANPQWNDEITSYLRDALKQFKATQTF